jgi:hypothetical protein
METRRGRRRMLTEFLEFQWVSSGTRVAVTARSADEEHRRIGNYTSPAAAIRLFDFTLFVV